MSTGVFGPLRSNDTGQENGTLAQLHLHVHQLEENLRLHKPTSAAELANAKRAATQAAIRNTPTPAPLGTTAPSPAAVAKQLEGKGGPGVFGQAAGAVGEAGQAALNAPAELITGAGASIAGEVASKVAGLFVEAFGAEFVKALLYVVLAGGGAVLLVSGLGRATGTHPGAAIKSGVKKDAVAGVAA